MSLDKGKYKFPLLFYRIRQDICMAKITFNEQKTHLNQTPVEVQPLENVMFELLRNGHPVASSCTGEGVCGKCKITILKGMENINSETDLEIFLRQKNGLKENERISCQIQLHGDIQVDTSYW